MDPVYWNIMRYAVSWLGMPWGLGIGCGLVTHCKLVIWYRFQKGSGFGIGKMEYRTPTHSTGSAYQTSIASQPTSLACWVSLLVQRIGQLT